MSKSKKIKWSLFAGLIIILLTIFVFFTLWADKSVSTKPNISSVQGITTGNTVKLYQNSYFSTMVPDYLLIKHQDLTSHGNTLLQVFMSGSLNSTNRGDSDQLGITVGKLPTDGLLNNPDIQLRNRNPDIYVKQDSSSYPTDSLVFVKSQASYELSIFWSHKSKFAAVVLTSTVSRSNQLEQEAKNIISNWQWSE